MRGCFCGQFIYEKKEYIELYDWTNKQIEPKKDRKMTKHKPTKRKKLYGGNR